MKTLKYPSPDRQPIKAHGSGFEVNAMAALERHATQWAKATRDGQPTVENPNPPAKRVFLPPRRTAVAQRERRAA